MWTRAIFSLCAAVAITAAHAKDTLDPSGYYFPTTSIKNFESLQWIELWDRKGSLSGSMRLTCSKCTNGFENEKLVVVDITGRSVSLRSAQGLAFKGDFLVGGRISDTAKDNAIVLRGTLSHAGKEASVEFIYSVGD